MTRRNLLLIHRGDDYERDFVEITEKTHALDRSITIFSLPAAIEGSLPDAEWRHPTLTVAMTSKFRLSIKRGPVLQSQAIGKLAQQDILRQHGLPTPAALPFSFGMMLDPVLFGETVVLKPMELKFTSQGLAYLFGRRRLAALTPKDLPPAHPLVRYPDSFMVQKYVDTGIKPYCIRVGTFLAKTIYCYTSGSDEELAYLDTDADRLEPGMSMWPPASERKRKLIFDEDAIQLAEATHRAFPSIPLLGIDLLRDHATRQLYVLEVNAGGNTWHFASKIGEPTRRSLSPSGPGSDASLQGRLALLGQFGAFDIAAQALVAKTRELSA